MIKRTNTTIIEWLRYLMITSVDMLVPGWLDCVMDCWFDGTMMMESLYDPKLPAELELDTGSLVKNNKLVFDFNLN